MLKLNHMLLVTATSFAGLAAASLLAPVGVREQRLATVAQVDAVDLMSTGKDLLAQVVEEPY